MTSVSGIAAIHTLYVPDVTASGITSGDDPSRFHDMKPPTKWIPPWFHDVASLPLKPWPSRNDVSSPIKNGVESFSSDVKANLVGG